jgi:hypothetical protein
VTVNRFASKFYPLIFCSAKNRSVVNAGDVIGRWESVQDGPPAPKRERRARDGAPRRSNVAELEQSDAVPRSMVELGPRLPPLPLGGEGGEGGEGR